MSQALECGVDVCSDVDLWNKIMFSSQSNCVVGWAHTNTKFLTILDSTSACCEPSDPEATLPPPSVSLSKPQAWTRDLVSLSTLVFGSRVDLTGCNFNVKY